MKDYSRDDRKQISRLQKKIVDASKDSKDPLELARLSVASSVLATASNFIGTPDAYRMVAEARRLLSGPTSKKDEG